MTTSATALRSTPAADAPIAAALPAGAELTIIDAAVEVDGVTWWPVRDTETGALGYLPATVLAPAKA